MIGYVTVNIQNIQLVAGFQVPKKAILPLKKYSLLITCYSLIIWFISFSAIILNISNPMSENGDLGKRKRNFCSGVK